MQYNWMTLYCHTLSRCDLLALGGLIAYWHFVQPIKLRLPDWLLGVVVFVFVVLLGIVDNSNFEALNLATVKKYLFAAPLVFIFCFFVFNTSPLAVALNNNKIIDYLGKISFGLYMYHSIIIDNLERHNLKVPYYPLYLQPVLVLVLTIIVSALSYELFEKQILLLKKRFEVIKTQKSLEKQPVAEMEKQLV
jgi:peptidoglycan/LPS O-acetylase OafA/YrhL